MNQTRSHPQPEPKKDMLFFTVRIIIIFLLVFIAVNFYYPLYQIHNKKPSPFISRDGTQLLLEGQPFHPIGVNDYGLAYKGTASIDETFKLLHENGVNTIRFWLFNDGDPNGFQPAAGMYNESRFKMADYVLYDAKKYNIKVIPVLINNWSDYGGKAQYLKWIGKDPTSQETNFYTDPQITALVEKYINHILTRKNTYTKISYADDPAILGWDIMNEPRSTDQDAMESWLITMAGYMKQHDRKHLVFVGTENASVIEQVSSTDKEKSSNLCANPAVDICSVHLYLYNSADNQLFFTSYHEVTQFIQGQKDYANSVNKPLLMEELGIPYDTTPYNEHPLSVMKQIITYANQVGYAGFLIWDWSDTPLTPLTFSPQGNAQGNYSLQDIKELFR